MSPLLGRHGAGGDGGGDVHAAELARADESRARIEAGSIPLAAVERLKALSQSGEDGAKMPFGSDLSINEFALLASLDIKPITLVMGSSIYHVGWQTGPGYYYQPGELTTLSGAYNESRRRALARLHEEAELAGADAVVGVRIAQGAHDWAAGAVEFIAIGTAVRLPEKLRAADGGTVITDLSGQEYWRLCAEGIRPVGVVAHTSIYCVPATWQTQMLQRGGGMFGAGRVNQELHDFTAGVYAARERALRYLTDDATALHGDGIVAVKIAEHTTAQRVRRGGFESEDLIVTFHVIGTVIREDPALAQTPPQAARSIISLG
jgi:uncharacterized protein YbjQ (UPF0145 family)